MQKHLDFVDKSLFIQQIIDDTDNEGIVIIRPRRFGKTVKVIAQHV